MSNGNITGEIQLSSYSHNCITDAHFSYISLKFAIISIQAETLFRGSYPCFSFRCLSTLRPCCFHRRSIQDAPESVATMPVQDDPGIAQEALEAGSRERFTHQRLTGKHDIRLLGLEPSKSIHDAVRGRLASANLAQQPRYEALSYVWGDARTNLLILLQDQMFEVFPNLGWR